jgi:hypothetical protein
LFACLGGVLYGYDHLAFKLARAILTHLLLDTIKACSPAS